MGRGANARTSGHLTKEWTLTNALVASQVLPNSAATITHLATSCLDVGDYSELIFLVTTTSKSSSGDLVVSVIVETDKDGTRGAAHATISTITTSTTTRLVIPSGFGRWISLSVAVPAETGSYKIELIGKA